MIYTMDGTFFDQPLETKFKFIKITISSIMETILLFVDKIIKKLKNQHLSKQILDFVLKFLHDRQKYTDMLSYECVLFKSKLSILEQTIKIKYNIEIKTIQNMLMPYDIESLENDLYRSKLVSAPVVSQEIVRAPVISLNSPQNDFVSVTVPSINPSVSGNPPRQSLFKRLGQKIKKTFTRRRRGGKKKKKEKKNHKKKKKENYKKKEKKKKKKCIIIIYMASFKYNTVEELLTPQERFALYEQRKKNC